MPKLTPVDLRRLEEILDLWDHAAGPVEWNQYLKEYWKVFEERSERPLLGSVLEMLCHRGSRHAYLQPRFLDPRAVR